MEATAREEAWATLMTAAIEGDAAAYRDLLRQLGPVLRATTRRGFARAGIGGADVEDVVQETLLAIHLKRHTWDRDRPIVPWVAVIARHKLLDALRRRGRRAEVGLDLVVETAAAEPADDPTERHDASRLIDRLGGRQAAIVRAISLDGQSAREAADRLGMTEGAVRVALHRGLQALARLYRGGGA